MSLLRDYKFTKFLNTIADDEEKSKVLQARVREDEDTNRTRIREVEATKRSRADNGWYIGLQVCTLLTVITLGGMATHLISEYIDSWKAIHTPPHAVKEAPPSPPQVLSAFTCTAKP